MNLFSSMEYFETYCANEVDLQSLVQFMLMKQNKNCIPCLSTLCLNVPNGNDAMNELKKLLHIHSIKRIDNQIYLH
jgi:hypothetical protein